LPENNVGNTPYHFSSITTINPTASGIKEKKNAYVLVCIELQYSLILKINSIPAQK